METDKCIGGRDMRFRAYDIMGISNNNFAVQLHEINSEELFHKLNKMPKIEEGTEEYAVLYMTSYKEYILGTLVQSYTTVLTKFDETNKDSKKEIELEDNTINDKVLFYINTEECRIYVQSKRYPTQNLSMNKTLDRLDAILQECLKRIILLQPAKIDYTITELDEIFSTSYVDRIIFKNFSGIEIPEDAVIHNPHAEWDKAAAESWNCYSKNDLNYMEFRSAEGKKINKNPLVRIGMVLARLRNNKNQEGKDILHSMEIVDNGEKSTIKPKGNDSKIINIPKKIQNDPYESYERILKKNDKNYRRDEIG